MNSPSRALVWPAALAVLGGAAGAPGAEALLDLRDVPAHGVVVADVNLRAALVRPSPPRGEGGARAPGEGAAAPAFTASATAEGQAVPVLVVPALDAGRGDATITLILRLPRGGNHRVALSLKPAPAPPVPAGKMGTDTILDGKNGVCPPFSTPWVAVTHDPAKMGGLPSRIEFLKTGKVFQNFTWQDRLHHRQQGGYLLRSDAQATVELIAAGPPCAVVRVHARYLRGTEAPESKPEATYDWFYFRDVPLVYVRAAIRQQAAFAWDEIHFLELNFADESFTRWAGGEPLEEGAFKAAKKGFSFPNWGALLEGPNAIGVARGGRALFYDGRGEYGTYLHAHGDEAWQGWKEGERRVAAWLWMGSDEKPAAAVPAAARALPDGARAVLTTPAVRERIEAERAAALAEKTPVGRQRLWRAALAERLEAQGRLDEVAPWLDGKEPASWTTLAAGELALVLERSADGLAVQSLYDLKAGRELLSARPEPLFVLTARHAPSGREVRADARSGWGAVDVEVKAGVVEIRWSRPADAALSGVTVVAGATPDPARHAIGWTLRVENTGKECGVWRVGFPRVALGAFGDDVAVFFPRGPGEVKRGLHKQAFRYGGTYPDGWTAMQFMAAYDEGAGTGLYVGMHDGEANTKEILVEGRAAQHDVLFAFDHPAPDMGKAGVGFGLSGRAVWQLLRGDWYDAARIYREWVRREARWFPELGEDGRADTPLWMRELPAWVQGGGAPKECVAAVKRSREFVGVPTGFHWYNWHRIPFDNDYPHYFPPKDGFGEGVKELQDAGVFVMPYINGRLWDTRDHGTEDAEFTRTALPAATKDEHGKALTESYGSKEADGSPVVLAAMCPATELWQRRVREIVLRLMNEYGTKSVYIDQIAAAAPKLCFDASHGHPLGGGNWWWRGYVKLLEELRREMPKDRMITTECNAEPFVRWFDGYLTWHWQFDGQVPAFPAVYGGAIQMFGRAYRGGATKDLALRMKAGQQLVFGEQPGWLDPGVVREKGNGEFFRDVVKLRWVLRRYFYAGEMSRPPKLAGEMPTVKADWQWAGPWPVTTDAVLTGAWRLEKERKLVLLFVNVSDGAVAAGVRLNLNEYGLKGETFRVATSNAEGPGESWESPAALERRVDFAPRKAWAWEVTAR